MRDFISLNSMPATLLAEDFKNARRALEKADVKEPIAIVDPSWDEEKIEKFLSDIFYT